MKHLTKSALKKRRQLERDISERFGMRRQVKKREKTIRNPLSSGPYNFIDGMVCEMSRLYGKKPLRNDVLLSEPDTYLISPSIRYDLRLYDTSMWYTEV